VIGFFSPRRRRACRLLTRKPTSTKTGFLGAAGRANGFGPRLLQLTAPGLRKIPPVLPGLKNRPLLVRRILHAGLRGTAERRNRAGFSQLLRLLGPPGRASFPTYNAADRGVPVATGSGVRRIIVATKGSPRNPWRLGALPTTRQKRPKSSMCTREFQWKTPAAELSGSPTPTPSPHPSGTARKIKLLQLDHMHGPVGIVGAVGGLTPKRTVGGGPLPEFFIDSEAGGTAGSPSGTRGSPSSSTLSR